jgi:hypothetical protein
MNKVIDVSNGGSSSEEEEDEDLPTKGPEYQLPFGFDILDMNRFVGIDPGYSTLFCASVRDHTLFGYTEDLTQISLSTKQYRHESKMPEQRFYYQQLLKREPELYALFKSAPSFKTTHPSIILEGVSFLAEHADYLFETMRHSALPKFKFKVQRFSAKSLTTHCKKIVGETPETTVVGIGDWSQHHRGGFLKGGVGHAPNKKLVHELKKRNATVILLDEYKTSQFCFKCKNKLEKVYLPCHPTKRQQKKIDAEKLKNPSDNKQTEESCSSRLVHHVLHCSNNECGMWWNRDVNSSLHQEQLLTFLCKGWERPAHLSRGVVLESIY